MDWKIIDVQMQDDEVLIIGECRIRLEALQETLQGKPLPAKAKKVKAKEKPAKRKYRKRKPKDEPAEEPNDDVSDEEVEALEKLGKASKKAKAIADTGPYFGKYSKERP